MEFINQHYKLTSWLGINLIANAGLVLLAPTNTAALEIGIATAVVTGAATLLWPNRQYEGSRFKGLPNCQVCGNNSAEFGVSNCGKLLGIPTEISRTRRLGYLLPSAVIITQMLQNGCGLRNVYEGVRRATDFGGKPKYQS